MNIYLNNYSDYIKDILNKTNRDEIEETQFDFQNKIIYCDYIFKNKVDFLKNKECLNFIHDFKDTFNLIIDKINEKKIEINLLCLNLKILNKLKVKIILPCKIEEYKQDEKGIKTYIGEMNIYDDFKTDTDLFYAYLEENLLNCNYTNYNSFELLKLGMTIEII